jgi:hypothetical protein
MHIYLPIKLVLTSSLHCLTFKTFYQADKIRDTSMLHFISGWYILLGSHVVDIAARHCLLISSIFL